MVLPKSPGEQQPLTGLAVLFLGILLTLPSGLARAASLMGTQPCGT